MAEHCETPAVLAHQFEQLINAVTSHHRNGGSAESAPLLAVEIEIGTRCNRRCSYCPTGVAPLRHFPKFMERSVFSRVIEQLATFEFSGRLSYHLYNEPLLRKDLADLVRLAKQKLPKAIQVVYTNGDMLDDRRYEELIGAGVFHFIVTRHDCDSYPTRSKQTILLPTALELTNRGGFLFTSPTLASACLAPWEMLIVAHNGDVLLCYEDAERRHILGNLVRQDLREIWSHGTLVRLRTLLKTGRRNEACGLCQNCSNVAHAMPGSSLFAL